MHIHAEGPAFFCWLPKLFGKRVVVTIHGLDWDREKWRGSVASKFIRGGEKNAVKYADEIIVLSKGVVCVNTALPLCKQFFAAAHELYHIYCYVENADQSYIKNGSMLDSATGDETGRTQEDLEANAFAGLLLMPDQLLHEQILLYGLDKDLVSVDSVLMLMDMFAMPYKAVVLRLFESGNISHQQSEKLLEVGSADVMERVSLTGKAKRWQLDGKGTESFGTLLEKVEYNRQHEYLTESREKEDVAYLTQLKKEYGLD